MSEQRVSIVADETLRALHIESACLQALVEAGYGLDEAVRWIETWAGEDAHRLWTDQRAGAALAT